jgi:hypothetical protein
MEAAVCDAHFEAMQAGASWMVTSGAPGSQPHGRDVILMGADLEACDLKMVTEAKMSRGPSYSPQLGSVAVIKFETKTFGSDRTDEVELVITPRLVEIIESLRTNLDLFNSNSETESPE